MSDELLLAISFEPAAPLMPQLFVMRTEGHMITLAVKIFDDFLVTVLEYIITDIIDKIDTRITLRTVVHGPGAMPLFGINLFQHELMTVQLNAYDKLNVLLSVQISGVRRGEADIPNNQIGQNSFASDNASVGWLVTILSRFSAQFASGIQQFAPSATVRDYCAQTSGNASCSPSRRPVSLPTQICLSFTRSVSFCSAMPSAEPRTHISAILHVF